MTIVLISVASAPSLSLHVLADELERADPRLQVVVSELDLRRWNSRWHPGREAGWGHDVDRLCGLIEATASRVVAFSLTLWNSAVVLELCERLRRLERGLELVLWGPEAVAREGELVARGLRVVRRPDLAAALLDVAQGPRRTAPGNGARPLSRSRLDELVQTSRRFATAVLLGAFGGGELPLHLWRCNQLPPPAERLEVNHARVWMEAVLRAGLPLHLADHGLCSERQALLELLGKLDAGAGGRLSLELPVELLDEKLVARLREAKLYQLDLDLTQLGQGDEDPARVRSCLEPLRACGLAVRGLLVYGLPSVDYRSLGRAIDRCLLSGIEELQLQRLVVPSHSALRSGRGEEGLVCDPSPPYEVVCHARASLGELLKAARVATTLQLLAEPLQGTGLLRALTETLGSGFELIEGFGESLATAGHDPLDGTSPRELEQHFAEYLRRHCGVDLGAEAGRLRLVRSPGLSLRWLGNGSRLVTDEATGRTAHLGREVLDLVDRFDQAHTVDEICESMLLEAPLQRRRQRRRELRLALDKLATMGFLVPYQQTAAYEPSGGEAPFTGLEEFDFHYRLLADHQRVEAFRRAIAQTVRPGQHVVEVGTGTGILAVLAAQAGARVTAIERYAVLEVARAVAQRSGVAERIDFVRGRSDLVQLPERGDLLLSELVGNRILNESMLEITLDARERLLRSDAALIPQRIQILAQLGHTPRFLHLEQEFERVSRRCGMDLQPVMQWFVERLAAGQVILELNQEDEDFEPLSAEVVVIDLDLRRLEQAEFTAEFSLLPTRKAVANAVVLPFRLELQPGIVLSTEGARHGLHWNKPVFMLPAPCRVETGRPLRLGLSYESGGELRLEPR